MKGKKATYQALIKAAEDAKALPTAFFPQSDSTVSKVQHKPPSSKKTVAAPPLSITDKTPTLPELLSLEIPLHVGVKYETFGIFLLKDKAGKRVDIIKKDCRGISEDITMEILKEWLNGKGTEVSWKSLVKTLRKCKINFLADQIEMAIEQLGK
jgi:hypothetical protein